MKAIRVHELGGPDVLRYEDVIVPEAGARQAVVKVEAIGLNFVDCNYRKGAYKTALPFTPGMEAAGTVAAVGPEVTEIRVGDRVTYAPHMGAYAEYARVPVERLAKVPDGLDARSAAAAILQGMRAHYLATSVYPLKKGDTALVHAAAGDAGLLPRVHQVVALLTPWMMGTHQGAGSDEHIDCHPDECTFRVSCRTSRSRRKLFCRLVQPEVAMDPVSSDAGHQKIQGAKRTWAYWSRVVPPPDV